MVWCTLHPLFTTPLLRMRAFPFPCEMLQTLLQFTAEEDSKWIAGLSFFRNLSFSLLEVVVHCSVFDIFVAFLIKTILCS